MHSAEETLSHGRLWNWALTRWLGAENRRAKLLPDADADPQGIEAMLAAARCAFAPVEVRREGSRLRYSPAPEAFSSGLEFML